MINCSMIYETQRQRQGEQRRPGFCGPPPAMRRRPLQGLRAMNTHLCQLPRGILASTLKLGQRGRDFENTSDIEMSVYFTDTGRSEESRIRLGPFLRYYTVGSSGAPFFSDTQASCKFVRPRDAGFPRPRLATSRHACPWAASRGLEESRIRSVFFSRVIRLALLGHRSLGRSFSWPGAGWSTRGGQYSRTRVQTVFEIPPNKPHGWGGGL